MNILLLSTGTRGRGWRVCVWLLGAVLLCRQVPVRAETAQERIQAQQEMTVESNEIPGWPTGPVVTAQSAILMEAETGTVLYAKNIHARQYPASTTKILTALIAAEQCSLDEWVTFSKEAIYDTPRDSNHIAMDVGQQLTVEDCLNAILIRSANEVSFAVAEHISGTSWQDFADIMNERAAQLGCVDSHFVNPNGLPDENHYTSAYDLAMIGRAFFANEMLCRISLTPRLHILPNDHMPYEKLENSKIELLPGRAYGYDGLVGVKTGYTNAARYSIVSCAERDGLKLICVILNDESPAHYEDTIALFNYGFGNFSRVNVSQVETKYNMDNTDFFYGDRDIFGSSKPLLSLNQEDYIVLPRTVDFSDTVSAISYDTADENQAAVIQYSYQGVPLGSVSVDLAVPQDNSNSFGGGLLGESGKPAESEKTPVLVFIDVKKILMWVGIVAASVLTLWGLRRFLKEYHFPVRRTNTRHSWIKDRRKHHPTEYEESQELSAKQLRRKQIREARRRQRYREEEEDSESYALLQHRRQVKEARRRQKRREDEERPGPGYLLQHRQEVREARRRQLGREDEERPDQSLLLQRRQEVREARRRLRDRMYEEKPGPDYRRQLDQEVKEARNRQKRRGDEEKPEFSFRRQHRQEVKEARRRQLRRKHRVDPEPSYRRLDEPQAEDVYCGKSEDT